VGDEAAAAAATSDPDVPVRVDVTRCFVSQPRSAMMCKRERMCPREAEIGTLVASSPPMRIILTASRTSRTARHAARCLVMTTSALLLALAAARQLLARK